LGNNPGKNQMKSLMLKEHYPIVTLNFAKKKFLFEDSKMGCCNLSHNFLQLLHFKNWFDNNFVSISSISLFVCIHICYFFDL